MSGENNFPSVDSILAGLGIGQKVTIETPDDSYDAALEMDNIIFDDAALEKMQYDNFVRNSTVFRMSQLGKFSIEYANLVLPNFSVVHTVGNFQDMGNPSITPNIHAPYLENEQHLKYLQFATTPAGKATVPLATADSYTFPQARYISAARAFFARNKTLRQVISLDAIAERSNTLIDIEYNPILRAVIKGSMITWRRFDLLLRTVLNNAAQIPRRNHFIHIPVSNHVYQRARIEAAIRRQNTGTVNIQDDFTFAAMVHLLGFVMGPDTYSLFNDLRVLNDQEVITEEEKQHKDYVSPYDRILRKLNVIISCNGRAIIYNLANLRSYAESSSQLHLRVYRHITMLQLTADKDIPVDNIDDVSDENFDLVIAHKTRPENDPAAQTPPAMRETESSSDETEPEGTTAEESPKQATGDEGTPIRAEKDGTSADDAPRPWQSSRTVKKDHLSQIHDRLEETVRKTLPDVKDAPERVAVLHERHMQVTIGGKPIHQHLSAEVDTSIKGTKLDFLQDIVADKSMLTSTILDMDREYTENHMDRHIAQALTSLMAHGMFVSSLLETDEITTTDRVRHYTVELSDIQGRRHSITFQLPLVNKHGTMTISGVDYRMIKQPTTLPLCKVSPNRVSLASYLNKYYIERVETQANNFASYVGGYINGLRKAGLLQATFDAQTYKEKLPYDYTTIGAKYGELSFGSTKLTFGYTTRFDLLEGIQEEAKEEVRVAEQKHGVFFGYAQDGTAYYFGNKGANANKITVCNPDGSTDVVGSFTSFLYKTLGDQAKPHPVPSEWTYIRLKGKDFPVFFVLAYRSGLTDLLKQIGAKHRFIQKGTEGYRGPFASDEVVVTFADGRLIFPRYPLEASFVLSGLNRFDLRQYTLADMDVPGTYFRMMEDAGWSTNMLKAIDGAHDFFVDPITFEVLQRYNLPTTFKELVVKGSNMLVSVDALQASSVANQRMRGYERMPGTLISSVYQHLESYVTKRQSRKGFSIPPNDVFLRIVQDPSVVQIDELNPVHALKQRTVFTYTGSGGRSATAFVTRDRVFPEDGIGIISEATPDSGRVSINAFTSVNPLIDSVYGTFATGTINPEDLPPSRILSGPALLMPGSTIDD